MDIIEKLNTRYASKAMNGTSIPEEKKQAILESIRLAPTSLGLQAFKVLIVEDNNVKKQIFEKAATGQPQILKSAFTLIFTVPKHITSDVVDSYFSNIKEKRPLPQEKLEAYRKMVVGHLSQPSDTLQLWTSRQVYIALGFALYTAALLDVDSVPIEGFNKDALDELLHLEDKNLTSVCIMAVGNRDEELDYNARLPKVRRTYNELFVNADVNFI